MTYLLIKAILALVLILEIMGEAKRRQKLDPNYGKPNMQRQIHQLKREDLENLNLTLTLWVKQILTSAANFVGDIEFQQSEVQGMESYQTLKQRTHEILDFIEECHETHG